MWGRRWSRSNPGGSNVLSHHDQHLGQPAHYRQGKAYTNQYFEIELKSYDVMFEILPPLFMGPVMFAFTELKAGFVGSVFFFVRIAGRDRWFTGYCDLGDCNGPEAMRAAIIEHETANEVRPRAAANAASVEAIGD
ncbi:MAG: DUF1419 domain-containing protein [Novosphingobium sp.]